MADIKAAEQQEVQNGGGGIVAPTKKKSRASREDAASKRRCVSTACIACRKRKSKCNGNTPSCAACSSVYGTGKLQVVVIVVVNNALCGSRG